MQSHRDSFYEVSTAKQDFPIQGDLSLSKKHVCPKLFKNDPEPFHYLLRGQRPDTSYAHH